MPIPEMAITAGNGGWAVPLPEFCHPSIPSTLSACRSVITNVFPPQVIEDRRNYGACFSQDLRDLNGGDATSEVLSGDALKRALVGKQVESLESTLKAMNGAV